MSGSPEDRVLGGRIKRLLEEARTGSAEALGELFRAFEPLLRTMARAELPDNLRAKLGPSDLVQSTFLEAQRDFPSFRGASPAELQAWLGRILQNNLRNRIREFLHTDKRDVAREVPLDGAGSSGPGAVAVDRGPSPSDLSQRQEEEDLLRQALARLEDEEREVILLRQQPGISLEEVACRLRRPSAEAARKFWARAVEKLEQVIEDLRRQRRAGL
jgi:RNA polymerase sigma-70 factor (ECF subfamily)